MNETQIARFRARLLAELQDLESRDDAGQEGQKTVTLDQQSVGRLSRMDALQQQAMSKATAARREQMRHRIAAALARMDEDEFGYCTECGDEIPLKRLELDPTVPTCVSCASG
ncbi:TraR/DksA family transcriptional regulator [Psychromarinibacter sp. C21-152]|uniref:TraR/DksA family transcriptional regulator n=1 Tax=Psychromarinibacter sediminicola TaxID=3033385 RepID=A0AAE3NU10_9RHOB|nr:TraR/DksA family transcriptional regulator [Psychromarinibacter sediminicola]MDF0600930.1 TraR/DksA family transcriptional regulator [Psychromarinibacter sediminicola]